MHIFQHIYKKDCMRFFKDVLTRAVVSWTM